MYEIEINGTVYQFTFGIGFYKDVNAKVKSDIQGLHGVKEDIGFNYMALKLADADPAALEEILYAGNARHNPRVSMKLLDEWIDTEADVEKTCEELLDFFEQSNALRSPMKRVKNALKEMNQ